MGGITTTSVRRNGRSTRLYSTAAGAAHKFFRILITDDNGATNYDQIIEVEVAAYPGGPNQVGGGTATASSNHGSFLPSYAFDGTISDASSWATNGSGAHPQWLQYEFTVAVAIGEVRITAGLAGLTDRCPKDFQLQGSSDGSAWTTLRELVGETGWGTHETRTYVI